MRCSIKIDVAVHYATVPLRAVLCARRHTVECNAALLLLGEARVAVHITRWRERVVERLMTL